VERIVQHSRFFPTPPSDLYGSYLDPGRHAAFTGAPVRIAATVGATFEAFEGRIHGTILHLTHGRQIVQSWRSFEWEPAELDSILILSFTPEGPGTRLDLAQINVPGRLFPTLQENWPMRYLDPWLASFVAKA
jgi:activator of HSP90 ATPase